MIRFPSSSLFDPHNNLLLTQLDLDIQDLERVAIVGRNGCGKTTLLRNIAGLDSSAAPSVQVPAGRRISFVPTRPLDLLLPWKSVSKNLEFFESLAANTKEVDSNAKALNLLSATGFPITSSMGKPVYTLSSGQQAILALHCGLLQRPDVLVIDEIISTLAACLRLSVADILRGHSCTIVCASHDADFVARLGARLYNLEPFCPN